jgi:hypothetical protein
MWISFNVTPFFKKTVFAILAVHFRYWYILFSLTQIINFYQI